MIFLELWRLCNKYTTGISKAEAAAGKQFHELM